MTQPLTSSVTGAGAIVGGKETEIKDLGCDRRQRLFSNFCVREVCGLWVCGEAIAYQLFQDGPTAFTSDSLKKNVAGNRRISRDYWL